MFRCLLSCTAVYSVIQTTRTSNYRKNECLLMEYNWIAMVDRIFLFQYNYSEKQVNWTTLTTSSQRNLYSKVTCSSFQRSVQILDRTPLFSHFPSQTPQPSQWTTHHALYSSFMCLLYLFQRMPCSALNACQSRWEHSIFAFFAVHMQAALQPMPVYSA